METPSHLVWLVTRILSHLAQLVLRETQEESPSLLDKRGSGRI